MLPAEEYAVFLPHRERQKLLGKNLPQLPTPFSLTAGWSVSGFNLHLFHLRKASSSFCIFFLIPFTAKSLASRVCIRCLPLLTSCSLPHLHSTDTATTDIGVAKASGQHGRSCLLRTTRPFLFPSVSLSLPVTYSYTRCCWFLSSHFGCLYPVLGVLPPLFFLWVLS